LTPFEKYNLNYKIALIGCKEEERQRKNEELKSKMRKK